MIPGEEVDVAVGIGFCGNNGLFGGRCVGGAIGVGEDGLGRFAVGGGEEFV